jgi:tRNA modification GTPase
VCERVFAPLNAEKQLTALGGYRAVYGHVFDTEGTIDECVATVFRTPHSYTGENVVELSCHGGSAVLRETLRLALEAGARPAQPGEFTRRAFMNGKMSLTQAEAVMDIIHAKGEQAARAAVAAGEGALARNLEQIKETLLNTAAWLAAWADFPEEEIPEVDPAALQQRLAPAKAEINRLLNTFNSGRLMREGTDTAIVGCPNVGKSTLMNLLCGHESSIVTHIAGTTRDVISEEILLGDIRLNLSDTAGIRETDDTVEQFGVERAKKRLETAQLILAVFDGSRALTEDDLQLLSLCKGRKAVAILNKNDLPQMADRNLIEQAIPYVAVLSAKEQTGTEQLTALVKELLELSDFDPTVGMLSNERQYVCARQVQERLLECEEAILMGMTLDAVAVSLDGALEALMELSGERVTEQVADGVFHQFCVGK